MFRKLYTAISLHYLVWLFGTTFILLLQLILSMKGFGFKEPFQASMFLKYLLLNLAWIVSLSLPLSGLFGSSSAYISVLLNKETQQIHRNGKNRFSRLAYFFAPAAALGSFVALISLVMCLFVVPNANLRLIHLEEVLKTGTVSSDNPINDRAMSVGQLLQEAKKISLENSPEKRQQKSEPDIRRNNLMVEVYKKFALPLLGFLLPILGSLMATILSKRSSGQRTILFLFDTVLLILIWILLIAGESWGNSGILPAFVSMFLTPALAVIIIVALTKRCGEIVAGLEVAQ